MTQTRAALTAEKLRELLNYDPETGIFTYRSKRGLMPAGGVAGSRMVRGNHSIGIDYRRYLSHRLAWLYMTGGWPNGEIDHIDGNPLNNAWSNLREATSGENKQNRRKPRCDSSHGYIGVCFHGQSASGKPLWRSRIQLNGKVTHLGLFETPEEAHQAYLEAKRRLHPYGTL